MHLLAISLFLSAAPPAPVAVMPFKNLQRDASLAWLEAGVSETMVSDLKRAGELEIVERAQLDRAMAEVSIQGESDLYKPDQAARIGRMVGAKTIVVGAFQKAGKKLRITARFVEVETGVVKGTAKATGRLTEVFSLQDAIVDELLTGNKKKKTSSLARDNRLKRVRSTQKKRKRLKRRPKRKKTKRSLEAYKIYAMSLSGSSDVKRLGLLREAIELDPDFVYAKDELKALEARLRGYERAATGAQQERGAVLLARIVDKGVAPGERSALARAHLTALESNRRYYTLAVDAARIYPLGLPISEGFDPAERAAFGLVLANARLRRGDLALQAGERYLQAFKAGPHYREVEALVREIVDERRAKKDQLASFAEDMQDPRAEAAVLKKAGTKRDAAAFEDVDWGECIASKWARLPDEIATHCSDYLNRWSKRADDEDIKERVPTASAWIVWARGRQGRYREALDLAATVRERYPRALATNQLGDGHRVHSIETYWMQRWPTDVDAEAR